MSKLFLASLLLLATPFAAAQETTPPATTFLGRYQARLAETLTEQPHWATPLVTVNARLEQGFRADFVRQTTPTHAMNWNYGNSKGFQFVPFRRVELRISPPPFFTHSAPKSLDGFGDIAFRMKYRLYGSSEEHRNAILTFDLNATIPTGKNGNGSCCATVSPVLEAGKGIRNLALTSTLGGSLPVSGAQKLGRSIALNNAIQYHTTHLLWLETEFNSTWNRGGSNDRKVQTFTTPGVILSRIPIHGGAQPLALTLGAGEQIALTHFHTYNHSPIFTFRLRF